MDPKLRIKPYAALALPYFDDLRDPNYKLANGSPIPQLFDWLEKEFIANHEIIKDIFPRSEEGEKAECL
uniref:Inorganic diphosphatase n=1 Tax=Caenorhabditis tropicalis TaxID=1561998 RepID=A0A1I7TN22_9PELO